MIQLIAPDCYDDFADELHAMHRLRYRVFKERLNWNVGVNGGYEIDTFDVLRPHYLLLHSFDARVAGCVRLLPSTGRTMLRDTFPMLLEGKTAPEDSRIWESSRFALDIASSAPKGAGVLLSVPTNSSPA